MKQLSDVKIPIQWFFYVLNVFLAEGCNVPFDWKAKDLDTQLSTKKISKNNGINNVSYSPWNTLKQRV